MSQIVPPKLLQMCFEHRTTGEIQIIEQKLISTTKELIDWTREVTEQHKLHFDGSIRWALREAPDIKEAVVTLTQALQQNPDLFEGYKANISIEFIDQYHRHNKALRYDISNFIDIDEIADTAAENFLNRWISQGIQYKETGSVPPNTNPV
jgi:hypothetical protein